MNDIDIILEAYNNLTKSPIEKCVPKYTDSQLYKEICDTKSVEEIAELIKNGEMPANLPINKIIRVVTWGYLPSHIKSIEEAKKLSRNEILSLIDPNCGWNGVLDAMPFMNNLRPYPEFYAVSWSDYIDATTVCLNIHYKMPVKYLFCDNEDWSESFFADDKLKKVEELLYNQQIPTSLAFNNTTDILSPNFEEHFNGSVTFKRFINPGNIFGIEWHMGRDLDNNEEDDLLEYNDPKYKYEVQRF